MPGLMDLRELKLQQFTLRKHMEHCYCFLGQRWETRAGMVVHTCNPRTREHRQRDFSECEGYTMSSRGHWIFES